MLTEIPKRSRQVVRRISSSAGNTPTMRLHLSTSAASKAKMNIEIADIKIHDEGQDMWTRNKGISRFLSQNQLERVTENIPDSPGGR